MKDSNYAIQIDVSSAFLVISGYVRSRSYLRIWYILYKSWVIGCYLSNEGFYLYMGDATSENITYVAKGSSVSCILNSSKKSEL